MVLVVTLLFKHSWLKDIKWIVFHNSSYYKDVSCLIFIPLGCFHGLKIPVDRYQ